MVIGPFQPCPTTNLQTKKKNTWPQKLLLTKVSREDGNPRNSVERILQKQNQSIKGHVIKGLQNLFPSALSFQP
jgi:hypothetical protein